jgi:schlafen family protein
MNLASENPSLPSSHSRAWYSAQISEFQKAQPDLVLGELAKNTDFALLPTQRDAWIGQIDILQTCLEGLSGAIYLEFTIPRMGRRIDTVLLVGPIVFVIEFKIGEATFDRSAIEQVWDYALDLKNFHKASHDAPIVPILVATGAKYSPQPNLLSDSDNVFRPISTSVGEIRKVIDFVSRSVSGSVLNDVHWAGAPYHPTPTIVEAARTLYAQHSVDAIARFDAGATNLRVTSRRVEELVDEARKLGRKIICFVTGVPGAGKTLVGLNVATRRRNPKEPTHAVFLSGNGPLVAVLHEALTRDEVVRRKACGEKVRKGKVGEGVKAFIQNVHHFRDDALIDPAPPIEHVVIFDEAQRAWNLKQTASFMQRKKRRTGFSQSEPEFLISCMDRHRDWAVVICLVGGGQEINTGEAGIGAWLDALYSSFPNWHVHISSRLTDSEYAAGRALATIKQREGAHFDDDLHLAVSMRSFRAENVSAFVKALLDRQQQEAKKALTEFAPRYPIAVTRNLDTARQWIRARVGRSDLALWLRRRPRGLSRMQLIYE